jgi:hypothetical protein
MEVALRGDESGEEEGEGRAGNNRNHTLRCSLGEDAKSVTME